MKFAETQLKNAYVIEPEILADERGKFFRVFCKKEFSVIGHDKDFVQFNHSVNFKKGTVRGLHFQNKPFSEIKLIRCICGSVFDVIVDLRSESPTFLKWFGTIISKENNKMMYVPEGFAHGFQTLEDNSELLYHHTEFYTPSSEGGLNIFDNTISIQFPIQTTVFSDRDKNLPLVDTNFKGI